MLPIIQDVHFEKTPDRLKVVMPTQREPVWLIVYSILMIVWIVCFVWGIVFIVRDVAFSQERYTLVFTIMLVVWLYIWYRLGKVIWRQWQYYAARREIMFVEPERLIIRRPVSLLGITDAYDMEYVSPFYFSEEESCPGFDYGSKRAYFGQGLREESARILVKALNSDYFDNMDVEDD